jgi:hypothetical protein
VAHLVEHLPSKGEALVPPKEKKKKSLGVNGAKLSTKKVGRK